MNCDRAQAAISERMDGEHLPSRVAGALDAHVAGCADCSRFVERAGRVRTAVRIRPAEQVPDLVDPIMAAIARENTARPRRARRRARRDVEPPASKPRLGPRTLAPVAAALAVGLVAGSLVVGGPWQSRRTRPTATAADVIRGARVAARTVERYHARFAIAEEGLSPLVPARSLTAELWFDAPGRYRLRVRDRTEYPDGSWTPTDLTYVEDGAASMRSGPTGCPVSLAALGCPPTRSVVEERSAYAPTAPVLANLVVPIDVLTRARDLTVIGTGTALGRNAIELSLPFERAAPLFPFLRMGGTWRPYFPDDVVHVWIDASDRTLLRATVFPSSDPARADWELRFGLPIEDPGTPILDAAAVAIDQSASPPGGFTIPGAARAIPLDTLASVVGFHPVTPTVTDDLKLNAAYVPPPTSTAPRSLLTYSRGLAYLRIGERRDWTSPSLFGPVGADAEEVAVGGGVAYYEPASASMGRRLAIRTDDTNLYLETNLPREELLAVAASLPLRGLRVPTTWLISRAAGGRTEQLSLAEAQRRASFAFDVPGTLPGGYVLATVDRSVVRGVDSVTMWFRQRDTDLAGGPLRVHLEPAAALPPGVSTDRRSVTIDGIPARWTPSLGRLEWVAGGLYRSIDAPGVASGALFRLASSLVAGG